MPYNHGVFSGSEREGVVTNWGVFKQIRTTQIRTTNWGVNKKKIRTKKIQIERAFVI